MSKEITIEDRFKNWLEERIENYELEKELHGKKERIQARLGMLKETLENYNRWASIKQIECCGAWTSVEDDAMPLEQFILVSHPYGIEAINFHLGAWKYWYINKSLADTTLKSITHWMLPKSPNDSSPCKLRKEINLDSELTEQIEQVLSFKESNVELAHRQQLIDSLYKIALNSVNGFWGRACSRQLTKIREQSKRISVLEEGLRECEEYFDNRADADWNGFVHVPNTEMRISSSIKQLLK